MKKYFILFLLPLALLGCKKKWMFINEFTFDIDGVHYDLSNIHSTNEFGTRIGSNDLGIEGFRYSKDSPLYALYYYFMGYNATNCENCSYGGDFVDTTVQKQTVFNVPDRSIHSYFWIEIDGVVYDAISGYIEMINDTKRFTSGTADRRHTAHGTFEFVMVNRENKLDTIHVTNGKFRYKRYVYGETFDTYN